MKFLLLIFVLTLHCNPASSNQNKNDHQNVASATWSIKKDGVFFSLTQLLPDQLRAFYVNRGFSLDQIKPFVDSCVFMTVLRNEDAPGTIHFISQTWQVVANQSPVRLRSVKDWIRQFSNQGITKPALIAFRWAQFPPEQEYEPGGDWNQGMLSIGLPAGSQFDITAKWDIQGESYETKLLGVECAR